MNNNYNNKLLSLFFTEPDGGKESYIHAFSYNENALNLILIANVPEENHNMFTIQPVKTYLHMSGLDSNRKTKHLLLDVDIQKYNLVNKPIYGIYMETNGDFCQSLLFIEDINVKYIKDSSKILNMSSKPVKMETFYPKGVLNS